MPASDTLLRRLPDALSERTLALSDGDADGGFVLVWMRTAARAHDNPALDAALHAADQLGVPVFVYHALSERYPYASDRHHRFILEGARDAQAALAERGLGAAFHLERPGHRGPHLRTLAEQAALVITEDLPVPPLTGWTRRLRDAVDTPVWVVDTACILPMRHRGARVDRAFSFRDDTEAERLARLEAGWTDLPVQRPGFVPDLPFAPVELTEANLEALIATCDIDHSVAPVPHTRGGSVAGYARWRAFVGSGGLKRYASDRNDPAKPDGVSRMSPWLHYGHVSPWRLAADAEAEGGRGGDKYLDELLLWRELAHAWCARQSDLHTLEALPPWAQATLRAHTLDRRPRRPTWDQLARAQSGDALWDACQRSLLQHGELHNNVRMTWGKTLVGWAPDPETARAWLVDLNHRYALDGRDPNSYGGLYWCLGLFDRPFRPEREVTGSIRPRTTLWHAGRIRMERYAAHVHRPLRAPPPRVAVVGAGVAGLACARTLQDHGLPVQVFEARPQVGGRLVAPQRRNAVASDLGAQYITARSPTWRLRVESFVQSNVLAVWDGRFGRWSAEQGHWDHQPRRPRFVGVPNMGALADHVARGLDVKTNAEVRRVERSDGGPWRLWDARGAHIGEVDRLVVATPPAAAARLLAGEDALLALVSSAEVAGCVALEARFGERVDLPFDALRVESGPLAWAARDSSKPGRADGEVWVAHARPGWPEVETDEEVLQRALVDALLEALGGAIPPDMVSVYRWDTAKVVRRAGSPFACGWDPGRRVGVCGDWLEGPKVEAAWLSGVALAGRILGQLAEETPGAAAPGLWDDAASADAP